MTVVRTGSFHLTFEQREKLIAIRKAAKVTQQTIAEALGLGFGTNVLFIEKGKRRLTLEELRTYLEACGADLGTLFPAGVPEEIINPPAPPPRGPKPRLRMKRTPAADPEPKASTGQPAAERPPESPKAIHLTTGPLRAGKHISATLLHLIDLVRDFEQRDLDDLVERAAEIRHFRDEAKRVASHG